MRIEIDKSEHQALNALRGLPEDAHLMVMTMRSTEQGGVLEGSAEALESLVSFISGELADDMVPGQAVPALTSLCRKIDPDCLDWLGT